MTMAQPQETNTELVQGGDIFALAQRTPLVLPVSVTDTIEAQLPTNGTDFKLKELYALLDCDTIDIVRIQGTDMIFVVDDEGAIASEPQFNEFATVLWRHYDERGKDPECAPYLLLFGKVLLCHTDMVR